MDAKAKVVAWQWQGSDGQWRECTFHGQDEYIRSGFPVRELVTLTDHEAALAELENLRRMYCTLEGQYQVVTESKSTLLTGLEALAERYGPAGNPKDGFDEGYDAACAMFCAQITTLTNSAKEST